MNKKEMLEHYRKTEREWRHLTAKKKAEKIKAHINHLLENEDNDTKTKQELHKQLIILDELESEEIESYLDMINKFIMENCMKNIKENYK
ncbi:hypothetical protein PMX22_11685 [Clostridium butyricum]|uniref:hypothetical protein n=1 Tax=Clostridium butyricum TaxID=1492 RepID=UPI00232BC56A|nr:hypothetical protein [Clostridium butyricum]MDB2160467.1 hypothetical protein [Clostridium butyricum]